MKVCRVENNDFKLGYLHNDEGIEDIIFHNNTEAAKNRSLWRGVILQAILDASSMAKRTENIVEKKRATDWLTNMNPDFIEVCHMAGYPPEYVRKKAITFLEKK